MSCLSLSSNADAPVLPRGQLLVDPWLVGDLTFGSPQLSFLYNGSRPDGA